MKRGALIRVGIDQTFGEWNAPLDPDTGEFIYVPIPESPKTVFRDGMRTTYEPACEALRLFCEARGRDVHEDLSLPRELLTQAAHLDPDFAMLTYGDDGAARGACLRTMKRGDLIAFYAGLRSIRPPRELIYSLIGIFIVDEVIPAAAVPEHRRHENAHTRKTPIHESDLVIRADPARSGRLRRAIPIGGLRERAYRVFPALLNAWGGLRVKNGFIQRSARPPAFEDPRRFYGWFESHAPKLVAANN